MGDENRFGCVAGRALAALVVAGACTAWCTAQEAADPQPEQAQPESETEPDGALPGARGFRPTDAAAIGIAEESEREAAEERAAQARATAEAYDGPSLVERDEDGALVLLDGLPELAALRHFELDRQDLDKLNTEMAERESRVDRVLAEHLQTVFAFRANMPHLFDDFAQKQRPSMYGRAARGKFVDAIKPLSSRGTLRDEIRGLLPEENRDGFDAMLLQYDLAVADERERRRGVPARPTPSGETDTETPQPEARGTLARNTEMRSYAHELAHAYDRVLLEHPDELEGVLANLELDADIAEKLRTAVSDELTARELDPREDAPKAVVIGDLLFGLTVRDRIAVLGAAREMLARPSS